MKLANIKKLHDKFTVDGLQFRLEDAILDMDGDSVEFSVTDNGGLEVGRFYVIVAPDGSFNFDAHPDHPQILDWLNRRNDTAHISSNVKKVIDVVRS